MKSKNFLYSIEKKLMGSGIHLPVNLIPPDPPEDQKSQKD
jgi:hypothetical protein